MVKSPIPHFAPQKGRKIGIVLFCDDSFFSSCNPIATFWGFYRTKKNGPRFLGGQYFQVVPKAGLEPARICIRQILSFTQYITIISVIFVIYCNPLFYWCFQFLHFVIFVKKFLFCAGGCTAGVLIFLCFLPLYRSGHPQNRLFFPALFPPYVYKYPV